MMLSLQMGFSFVRAAVACAILEIAKCSRCLGFIKYDFEFSSSADLSMRKMFYYFGDRCGNYEVLKYLKKLSFLYQQYLRGIFFVSTISQRLSFLYQQYLRGFLFCINNISEAFFFVSTISQRLSFLYQQYLRGFLFVSTISQRLSFLYQQSMDPRNAYNLWIHGIYI